MLKNSFTVKELAEILDIYEISANEILEGTIKLEADELLELSRCAGVSVEELMK